MFLTFFCLIIVAVIGYQVSYFFLGNKVKKNELLLISVIVGLTIMSYSVLLLSLIFKNLKTGVYLFIIIGGLLSLKYLKELLFSLKKEKLVSKNQILKLFLNKLKKIHWLEVIFLFLIILLFLDLASKTLVFNEGLYKVAGAGYGDIPFHMNQVSYFIHQEPFELENPIYSGQKLSYPFLINFLSSSFYILNNNYLFSFHLPSFILAISGIILLYLLISRIIKKRLVRISTFLIFFLGSGLGFLKILKDNSLWLKSSFGEAVNYILHLPYSIGSFDAIYPSQNIIWSSFLTMFLLHQRTFFFGFALGIVCLFIFYLTFKHKENKLFLLSGITLGVLPLVHIHTFIAMAIILFGFFLSSLLKKQKVLIKGFLKSAIVSFLIFLPVFFSFLSQKINDKGFLVFRLGWMTEKGTIGGVNYNPNWNFHLLEWLSFLWQNFGFFIPLLIGAAIYLIIYLILKKPSRKQKEDLILPLILSSLFLWMAINVIKFQPWDFDNTKIFGYFLLVGCLLVGLFFEKWKFKGAKILIILLTLLIITTGVIDALSRSSFASPTLYEIFSPKDQLVADWITKNTNSEETILTGNYHLNLVNCLAGRPVLMGYGGWLWTHGIKYQEREKDIKKMFEGNEEAKKLFKKYDIDYVMIGPKEKHDYTVNESFFNRNYPIIFQLDNTKIYRVGETSI